MARIEIGRRGDVGDGSGGATIDIVMSVDGVGDDSDGTIRVIMVRMELVMSVDCGGDEEIQNTVMGIAMVKLF